MRTQEFLSPSRFVYQTKDHRFGEDALQLAAFAEAEACPLVCDLGTGNGILPLWWHTRPQPPESNVRRLRHFHISFLYWANQRGSAVRSSRINASTCSSVQPA